MRVMLALCLFGHYSARMATEPTSVADRLLAEIRAEKGRQRITWPEVANRSGIPIHALRRRVDGHVEITFAEAERLAGALGVPYDELVARVTGRAA